MNVKQYNHVHIVVSLNGFMIQMTICHLYKCNQII